MEFRKNAEFRKIRNSLKNTEFRNLIPTEFREKIPQNSGIHNMEYGIPAEVP